MRWAVPGIPALLLGALPLHAAETASLYIDNDRPQALAATVDGKPLTLRPYEIRRVDLPPGTHTLQAAGGGERFGPHKLAIKPHQTAIFNPGAAAVYAMVRQNYGFPGAPPDGLPSGTFETIKGRETFVRFASYGPDTRFPRTVKTPLAAGSTERTRLKKVLAAADTPDRASAILAQTGLYYDAKTLEGALALLKAKQDRRCVRAAAHLLGQSREDFDVRPAVAILREHWSATIPPTLIESAARLTTERGRKPAKAIADLLLERLGPEETARLYAKAPPATLRNLMRGLTFPAGGPVIPQGDKARPYLPALRVGLESDDALTRERACTGMAALAGSLTDEDRVAARKVVPQIADARLRDRLAKALGEADARSRMADAAGEDTPESLARFLKSLPPPSRSPGVAVRHLKTFKKVDVVPPLIRELEGAPPDRKRFLIQVLLCDPFNAHDAARPCITKHLGDADAEVASACFYALVYKPALWVEGTEQALRAAMEKHTRLKRQQARLDRAVQTRDRQAKESRVAAGDLDTILANPTDGNVIYQARKLLRSRKLTDAEAAKVAKRFASATDKEKEGLCQLFCPVPHPGLLPLAAWGYANGDRRTSEQTLFWFDTTARQGHNASALALFDLWVKKRAKGERMPSRVRMTTGRVFANASQADAVKLARRICDLAKKEAPTERLPFTQPISFGLTYQKDEKIKKAVWKILGDFANALLRESDAKVRSSAFQTIARAARETKDASWLRDLRAAAARERDESLKRGFDATVKSLESRLK
jgi:hypothetical protein